MKFSRETRARAAFSWLELLVVIATVMLLVGVFYLWQPQLRSKRVTCVINLKIVGLAARMWSNDSMDGFVWTYEEGRRGTLEYVPSAEVFRHFDAESNYFPTPKALVCPSDPNRFPAASFGPSLSNSNISYFLCFDANDTKPQIPLSGDRNITGGKSNAAGLVFAPSDIPRWDASLHHYEGNLGLSDGSVQQVSTQALARQFTTAFQKGTLPALRLAIPRIPGDQATAERAALRRGLLLSLVGAGLVSVVFVFSWLLIRRRVFARSGDESLEQEET